MGRRASEETRLCLGAHTPGGPVHVTEVDEAKRVWPGGPTGGPLPFLPLHITQSQEDGTQHPLLDLLPLVRPCGLPHREGGRV